MNNKEIFNEGFWRPKQKSYAQKRDEKLPTYNRVDNKGNTGGNNGILSFDTKDTNEIKKRLTGVIGANIGNASIRSAANRSIKYLPIIVSEHIDPTTVILIKKHLETQGAEYLNQIISNQVIDITSFDRDNDSNIAIQAVDKILGNNNKYSKQNIAAKAMNGNIGIDDVMGGNSLYNLIRKESVDFSTLPQGFEELLEDAIIVESGKEDEVVNYLLNESNYLEEGAVDIINESMFLTENYGDNIKSLKDVKHWMEKGIDKKYNQIPNNLKTQEVRAEYQRLLTKLTALYTRHSRPIPPATSPVWNNLMKTEFKNVLNEIEVFIFNVKHPQRGEIGPSAVNNRLNQYGSYDNQTSGAYTTNQQVAIDKLYSGDLSMKKANDHQKDLINRGYAGTSNTGIELMNRLTAAGALADHATAQAALNKSVGDMLLAKGNEFIKDRFEKAAFLLSSLKISGTEYCSYLTDRLGIPVHRDVKRELLLKYPSLNTDKSYRIDGVVKGKSTQSKIAKQILRKNAKDLDKVIASVSATPSIALVTTSGLATGAGVSYGIATLGLASIGLGTLIPGVGAGVAAGIVTKKLIDKYKVNKMKMSTTHINHEDLVGWRRVEMLISNMDDNTFDLKLSAKEYANKMADSNVTRQYNQSQNIQRTLDGSEVVFSDMKHKKLEVDKDTPTKRDIDDVRKGFESNMRQASKPQLLNLSASFIPMDTKETFVEINSLLENIQHEVDNDTSITEDIAKINLQEKIRNIGSVTSPTIINKKISYNDKNMDVLPAFGTRNVVGYGSVEIDRREAGNRNYNTPLVLTVKFKERYSDGKYSDNELVAVIGVLGKITRVPSEEMEYILEQNAQGNTIKGIFNNTIDPKANISDIFSKMTMKKTPQSADVWNELERIKRTSVVNQITGKSNNNLANAHIIFSQQEVDNVRNKTGVDYIRDIRNTRSLMKRYAAMTLLIANDNLDRVWTFEDIDDNSWFPVPYSSLRGKDDESTYNTIMQRLR